MDYLVRSLSVNPGLGDMYGGSSIALTLGLGTWVIALFAFIFLFYTNSFLIKRRKKEFGMFNILGMEKKHLARMLLTETILVTVLSIGLGLGFGILLDKAMFLLMCKVVGAKISLGFFVSGSVIWSTVRLFGLHYPDLQPDRTSSRQQRGRAGTEDQGAVCVSWSGAPWNRIWLGNHDSGSRCFYRRIFCSCNTGSHWNLFVIYSGKHCDSKAA